MADPSSSTTPSRPLRYDQAGLHHDGSIGEHDLLLEALIRAHGMEGRPDIAPQITTAQKIAKARKAEFTLLRNPTADDLIALYERFTGRKATAADVVMTRALMGAVR
jgi:hypothetical protein